MFASEDKVGLDYEKDDGNLLEAALSWLLFFGGILSLIITILTVHFEFASTRHQKHGQV